MLAGLLDRLEEGEVAARAGVVGGRWQRAAGAGVGPDVGLGVGVVLGVVQRGGHVEHLAQGGVAEGAVGELRHQLADEGSFVERALGHQRFADQPGDRFGHRHHAVQGGLVQAAGVALVDDPAAMQHQQPVGAIDREGLVPGHRRVAVGGPEAHLVDRRVEGVGEGAGGVGSAAYPRGGHQLAEVTDRPAELVAGEVVLVGEADGALLRRREALHPAAGLIGRCRSLLREGGAGEQQGGGEGRQVCRGACRGPSVCHDVPRCAHGVRAVPGGVLAIHRRHRCRPIAAVMPRRRPAFNRVPVPRRRRR